MIGAGSLLTIAEATELLTNAGFEVRPNTVQSLVEFGRIEQVGEGKFIRYTRKSVEDYILETENAQNGDGENPPDRVEPTPTAQGIGVTQKHDSSIPETSEKAIRGQRTANAPKTEKDAVSEQAKKLSQEIADNTMLADLEARLVETQIRREELNKRRDLPDVLAKREAQVKAKEIELFKREQVIIAQETDQAQRAKDIEAKRVEAEAYFTQKKTEADTLVSDAKFKTDELEIQAGNTRDEIQKAEERLKQIQPEYERIEKNCRTYLHMVQKHAVAHYRQAEKTGGQVQDFHHAQTNRAWTLDKELKDLLKKIEAVWH